jgi:hypothetical protein
VATCNTTVPAFPVCQAKATDEIGPLRDARRIAASVQDRWCRKSDGGGGRRRRSERTHRRLERLTWLKAELHRIRDRLSEMNDALRRAN